MGKTENPYVGDARDIAERRKYKVVLIMGIDEWDRFHAISYGATRLLARDALQMLRRAVEALGIKGPVKREEHAGGG